MIDWYGRWTYDASDHNKNKWCDMDYVAHWIFDEMRYDVKMDLEIFILKMLDDYYEERDGSYYAIPDPRPYPDNLSVYIPDFVAWVYDQGGLKELEREYI